MGTTTDGQATGTIGPVSPEPELSPAVAAPDPVRETGPRLRAALQGLPGYVPGRAVSAPADRPAWKLSSNENPYPPLPGVLDVVRDVAAGFNRYPDATAGVLVRALADRFGVLPENLSTGPGSVGVLQQVLAAVAGPGDEVVHAWRSFEAYPILIQLAGATGIPVPLTADERHDLDAMADAITPRTRLVLLCSPNNPTGTALRSAELDRFLDRVPADVLVVLDEAYHEFVRDPQVPDGVEVWRRRPNVAVLRTFSKAYGLAGLRVGFGIAHPAVAAALRQTALPFGVSAVAQAAAVASLEQQDALLARVDALVLERDRVVGALRAGGATVCDTQANFVWLRLGPRTAEVTERCAAAGVAVRPFGAEGIRVTVGEAAANDTFLEVAAAGLG